MWWRNVVAILTGAFLSYIGLSRLLEERTSKSRNLKADPWEELADSYFAGAQAIQKGHFELMKQTAERTPIGGGTTIIIQVIGSSIYVDRTGWRSNYSWEVLRVQYVLGELKRLLRKPAGEALGDFEFILNTADCPMWKFRLPAVTFSMLRCEDMWMVPLPQWNHHRDGRFSEFDNKVRWAHVVGQEVAWSDKSDKAVFMGGLRRGTCVRADNVNEARGTSHPPRILHLRTTVDNWHTFSRGKMWYLAQKHPDMFDVGLTVGDNFEGKELVLEAMGWSPSEYVTMEAQARRYKYVVYLEGNCGWADRLKNLLALGMTIFLQDNICHEFFLPLLRPWVHYIPVRYDLSDLVERLQWARMHEDIAREIGLNAAEFAHKHLSKRAWRKYFAAVMLRYSKLMLYKPTLRERAERFKKMHICLEWDGHTCDVEKAFAPL